jgi:hypothetical protein
VICTVLWPSQIAQLALELSAALRVGCRGAGSAARVDLRLVHPLAHRLGADAQLLRHLGDRSVALADLPTDLQHHPDRWLTQLQGVLLRLRGTPVPAVLHPRFQGQESQGTQADSQRPSLVTTRDFKMAIFDNSGAFSPTLRVLQRNVSCVQRRNHRHPPTEVTSPRSIRSSFLEI